MNSPSRNDGTSDDETLRAFNEIMAGWDSPAPELPAERATTVEATRAQGDELAETGASDRPDALASSTEVRNADRSGRSVAEMRRLQAERRRRAEAAANRTPHLEPGSPAGPRDADISYLDAMERAEALMDADPENHFIPPEPTASLKPKNTGAFAALAASIVIAVAFGFFIDSPLSGAMTALGCTMFVFVMVYLAFKAASTQTPENSDEGTV